MASMRQTRHAMKFFKLSSGKKNEKKKRGETRFALRFGRVVKASFASMAPRVG
jgi:hypothetical protein